MRVNTLHFAVDNVAKDWASWAVTAALILFPIANPKPTPYTFSNLTPTFHSQNEICPRPQPQP